MTEFQDKVVEIVRAIPRGKVASYGQVALYVTAPRAARQVGWALSSLEVDGLPWWRVINTQGLITIKSNTFDSREIQRKLLRADGIVVGEDFSVDIKKYRYMPGEKALRKMGLDEDRIPEIVARHFC